MITPTLIPHTAMLFAAGRGTRMLPLTATTPKPLIEVAGIPIIARTLNMLKTAEVKRVVVNTHHLAGKVESYLAAYAPPPDILISHEEELLETGGAVVKALPLIGESPFFAINGDVIITDKNEGGSGGESGGGEATLRHLREVWADSNDSIDILLLLHPTDKATGYDGMGDFFVDDTGSIRPRTEGKTAPFVFTGIQILHPRLFAGCNAGVFSLSSLFAKLIGEKTEPQRIRAVIHKGGWFHVGDVKGLEMANSVLGQSN